MAENLNLVEQIRKTELLKSEIIYQTGSLYKSMVEGDSMRDISNVLSKLIIDIYQLGDFIGVSPSNLEQSIIENISKDNDINQTVANYLLKGKKTGKEF